jgi:aromatic ring-opening dioxygenase LigB subunit
MPYGCLDAANLSVASKRAIEKALAEWQGTRQISKPSTFLVIASHEIESDAELALKQELVARLLGDEESAQNVIVIKARNEEDLASKIAHTKSLIPIQTLILIAESRHALSLGPIFRRKFGKAIKIKKFKADFEFNHPWISTSSALVWSLRNVVVRSWFEVRKRTGRGLRKKLRFLFWS